MGYGAMTTDAAGVPFYIEGASPMTMLEHRVYNAPSYGQYIDIGPADGSIKAYFACEDLALDTPAAWTGMAIVVVNGVYRLMTGNASRNIHLYIFGVQFQPVPTWGIQLNDAQGRCILTNETKVLANVQSFGDPNNPQASGMSLVVDLPGRWAVLPAYTGNFVGVTNTTGQPIPIVAQYLTSARFNGSTTRIRSGYHGNMEQGTGTNTNYRNRITAVDVSRF